MQTEVKAAKTEPATLLYSEVSKSRHVSMIYLFIKRVFDIFNAILLGLILLIPMIMIAILVRIDSPGPAIFRQMRLGKDGKPITILKFRSMNIDAEKDGPQWAEKYDGRCTKVGKILRRSHLDELPQLWNILTGDMSFVGPRPEREYFHRIFVEHIPDFDKRLLVKPGLTGLAQVNGGYDLNPADKIKYDLIYIENRSVLMDCKCLIKTIRLVFTHEGAR